MFKGMVAAALAAYMVFCPAQPGLCGETASCEMTFALPGQDAFEAPLDRWLPEICDMARVRVDADRTGGEETARLTVRMGGAHAFTAGWTRAGGAVYLHTDLLADMPARMPEPDLEGDLCEKLCALALSVPSSGRLIPFSGDGLSDALRAAQSRLRAWAAIARAQTLTQCGQCGACEACRLAEWPEAAARVIEALAERAQTVGERILLTVSLTPVIPATRAELPPEAREAPDGTRPALLKNGVLRLVAAIAENGAVK